jgi:signal transduction histidine kinase
MRELWQRLQRIAAAHQRVVDACLAAALLIGSVATLSKRGQTGPPPADTTAYALVALVSAPYVFRRRAPLAVLVATVVPLYLLVRRDYDSGLLAIALLVACYTVASRCDARQALLGVLAVALLLTLVTVDRLAGFSDAQAAFNWFLFGGAFALGHLARTRRRYLATLREHAVLLERQRDAEAREARTAERLRIARELHDVIGHSMGVIAVQAGVGARVFDTEPDEARSALEAIADTSRKSLAEIRHILGVLHDTAEPAEHPSAARGLADLAELAAEVGHAGVPVTVREEGARHELPRVIDSAAYRIVQEALTNVIKHAGPAHAQVLVRHEPDGVALEVTDDGRGGPAANGNGNGRGAGHGHGLLGIRERVAVLGGSVETEPRTGGGYRVAARLPYRPPE